MIASVTATWWPRKLPKSDVARSRFSPTVRLLLDENAGDRHFVVVVVTRDCADLQALAVTSPGHPGMLLIFTGRISPAATLVRAIGRIESRFAQTNDLVLSLVDFT